MRWALVLAGLPHGIVLKYRRTATESKRSIEVTGGNSGIRPTCEEDIPAAASAPAMCRWGQVDSG